MPLKDPPGRDVLRRLSGWRLAGRTLHRVHRAGRPMWWFAQLDPTDPGACGRFDLPAPHGTCYTATTAGAAVLEAFQHDFDGGLLPASALASRRISSTSVPDEAPSAAQLTAQKALGLGVTAALWTTGDRGLTQRWAAELHGSGWQAMYHGVQHDPTGRRRAVSLFDAAGAHPLWGDERLRVTNEVEALSDKTVSLLAAHNITVTRGRPTLPVKKSTS